jgi:DNA-binding NarL/FixJ family response regulator
MAGQPYFSPGAARAIALTLWQESEPKSRPTAPPLSDREREFLRSFAEGLGYKEIASQMQVSVRTAETYRARLVRKLGCSTRAELVRYAVRHGLVEP